MGVLFISHSGRDNEAATKVRDWLRRRGWGQVFLDLDPEHGLAPGHRWQQELKQAGERCSGVLVLLSPNWVASRWCQTEFLVADQLGKKIFPVFIAPTSFDALPLELKAKFQIVDISDPGKEAEGFDRLAIGLKRAGLDPGSFEWPPQGDPHRPIYRGLQSLDEEDAAIFFGRDAQITKGLDALRRIRDGAPERMLVILGASGAGKSSFLKAGLIARLRRDEENFVVLPVIRPERAALTGKNGLAAALSLAPADEKTAHDIQKIFGELRTGVMDRLQRYAGVGSESYVGVPPTIVIPIDQAEELFATENTEAPHAMELLSGAVLADGNAVIVATIRSDSFAKMQDETRLAGIRRMPFDLAPIPHGAFKEVIEGPARLATPPLFVEHVLTEQLLKDLGADDALPLLAFTLERLLRLHRGGGKLTLSEYTDELGGLHGAITAAVEGAFEKAMRDPLLPHDRAAIEGLARAAFIPALVQIDDADAEPRRRVERLDALPDATRPLLRHLIGERLLVTDHRLIDGDEADCAEVAHEAILRQWFALKTWIAEEREGLRALDGVRIAAREWTKHAEGQGWLAHIGGRLDETERLLGPEHFANVLDKTERRYLAACRNHENAEREREKNDIEREKTNIARTRRLQRNIFILIAAAVAILLIAGFGIAQLLGGIAVRSSDALAKLSEQAANNQDYESAARYALAGLAGADWPVLGYSGDRAERALRTADILSRSIAILRGHDGAVVKAAFNPDGTRIVTASRDNTARIWDVRTGKQLAVLPVHSSVECAVYSPDGSRIITASNDKTIRIWDARNGKQLAILRGHSDKVSAAAYSPDGTRIVSASLDDTARIWDSHAGAQLAVLRGHDDYVETAAFSPDGTHVVTASDDNTVRIWDVRSGQQLKILRGHDASVYSAEYSPDGKRILTASWDKTARIWDAQSGQQLIVLSGHIGPVYSADYSRDGTRIVTASADKSAIIWDANSGAELAVLRGHEGYINGAVYSPDGMRIITAADDGTVRIWDAQTARSIGIISGDRATFIAAAFSPDGRRIVTASLDSTAQVWDSRSDSQITILRGHNGAVASVAFSPDGGRIITGSGDKSARVWDSRTGRPILVLQGHGAIVNSVAYSPNGARVVTASDDNTARIWNASTGAMITVLRGHEGALATAAFSPDGTHVVTSSYDRTARVWDANTGATITILRGHDDTVSWAAYDPDGRQIVTGSEDKTARIWDSTTGQQIAVLRGHTGYLESATFSPDGKHIITASQDGTVRIWDAKIGVQLFVLRGHSGTVMTAAYSPDNARIVSAADDKTVRIWSAPRTTPAVLLITRKELIAHTCKTLLAHGVDHFANEELAAAPNLDPKIDAEACHPPNALDRLRNLLFAVAVH